MSGGTIFTSAKCPGGHFVRGYRDTSCRSLVLYIEMWYIADVDQHWWGSSEGEKGFPEIDMYRLSRRARSAA